MSKIYFKNTDDAYTEAELAMGIGRGDAAEVTEQHPLPIQLAWKSEGADEFGAVDEEHALPVELRGTGTVDSRLIITPYVAIPGIVTGAFEAGDAFGTIGVFSKDIEGNPLPKKGFIVGAKLLDKDDDTLSATMHVFSDVFTPTTSKDALALLLVDSEKEVTVMGFSDGDDEGTYKLHEITVWNSFYYSPSQKLYFQFSTAGTPNIAAPDMVLVRLAILPG